MRANSSPDIVHLADSILKIVSSWSAYWKYCVFWLRGITSLRNHFVLQVLPCAAAFILTRVGEKKVCFHIYLFSFLYLEKPGWIEPELTLKLQTARIGWAGPVFSALSLSLLLRPLVKEKSRPSDPSLRWCFPHVCCDGEVQHSQGAIRLTSRPTWPYMGGFWASAVFPRLSRRIRALTSQGSGIS